jgi:hypothetical protein
VKSLSALKIAPSNPGITMARPSIAQEKEYNGCIGFGVLNNPIVDCDFKQRSVIKDRTFSKVYEHG